MGDFKRHLMQHVRDAKVKMIVSISYTDKTYRETQKLHDRLAGKWGEPTRQLHMDRKIAIRNFGKRIKVSFSMRGTEGEVLVKTGGVDPA
jgi:hypothetical protein